MSTIILPPGQVKPQPWFLASPTTTRRVDSHRYARVFVGYAGHNRTGKVSAATKPPWVTPGCVCAENESTKSHGISLMVHWIRVLTNNYHHHHMRIEEKGVPSTAARSSSRRGRYEVVRRSLGGCNHGARSDCDSSSSRAIEATVQ